METAHYEIAANSNGLIGPSQFDGIFGVIDTDHDRAIIHTEVDANGVVNTQSLPPPWVSTALPAQGVQWLSHSTGSESEGLDPFCERLGMMGKSPAMVSRSPACSSKPAQLSEPGSVGTLASAIPIEPTSPTMRHRPALTPEDIKRIVEKHELAEKAKTYKEDDECERVVKGEVDWTLESRLESERTEWKNILHKFQASQDLQFDQIISKKVREVMISIHNLSCSVEARFRDLEIEQRQRDEVFHRLHEQTTGIKQELETLHCQSPEHTQQKESMTEFARIEDQECFATKEDVKQVEVFLQHFAVPADSCRSMEVNQVEEFLQRFAVPADSCQSMEEQWQLFSEQKNQKVEMIQQSCSTLDASRDMQEQLQSLGVLISQKAEDIRESCVSLETHRKLEDRFQSFSSQTDQKLESLPQTFTPLKAFQRMEEKWGSLTSQIHEKLEAVLVTCIQHFAAECKTLSQEVQTLQKLNADHFPRLAKLELRLDTEASNCIAKFNELGISQKSECLTCQELLAAEGVTRKHEFEQLKMKVKQHDAAHADLAIAHQELTSSHKELSASYWNNQKKDTERVSQLDFLFEADRKLCMATIANAELGSKHI